MPATKTATDELVETLYNYAVAHPKGFTNADFMDESDCTLAEFNRAANKLRLILADDSITLICDPSSVRQKWVYRLVGSVDEGSPWVRNRLQDAESRFVTMASIATSLVNATDGRSVDGRRARLIQKAMTRLKEDLDDLSREISQ